jgi:hypothetical protein
MGEDKGQDEEQADVRIQWYTLQMRKQMRIKGNRARITHHYCRHLAVLSITDFWRNLRRTTVYLSTDGTEGHRKPQET